MYYINLLQVIRFEEFELHLNQQLSLVTSKYSIRQLSSAIHL